MTSCNLTLYKSVYLDVVGDYWLEIPPQTYVIPVRFN